MRPLPRSVPELLVFFVAAAACLACSSGDGERAREPVVVAPAGSPAGRASDHEAPPPAEAPESLGYAASYPAQEPGKGEEEGEYWVDDPDTWDQYAYDDPGAAPMSSPREAPLLQARPETGPDFLVDFGGPQRPVPPGLVTGFNDYNNGSPGAWEAYRETLEPEGGVVRLWLRQGYQLLSDRHFEAAREAKQSGLTVMLCCKGAPEYRGGAGKAKEKNAKPPQDAQRWAKQIAESVRAFLKRGIPVSHVEIWNEPDLPAHWSGTRDQFADFFCTAGKVLREELPPEVKVGGPGAAQGWAGGLKLVDKILGRCAEVGWVPDFISFHHYTGYATDADAFYQPGRIKALFRERGWPEPEIILSEWNIGLPGHAGQKAALDDHRAGVHFIGEVISLYHSGADKQAIHMLQDTRTHSGAQYRDYAGQDVGIFTLNGGPKALFNGIRMARRATELPAVPVERLAAPWNLALLATRRGDKGYILASNSFGKEDNRARKVLDLMGVDFSKLRKDSEKISREYLKGNARFEELRYGDEIRPAWEKARQVFQEAMEESKSRNRRVRLVLEDPPARVERLWLLDDEHGNPAENAEFMKFFKETQKRAEERAVEATLAAMRKDGLGAEKLRTLEKILRTNDRALARKSFDRPTQGKIDAAFRRATEAALRNISLELVQHPGAQPFETKPGNRVSLEEGEMAFALPPFSAVVLEVAW